MNILVIGSGGREHALARKIKESKHCDQLFVAPGNAGTANLAENVAIAGDDFVSLGALCISKKIALIVVGPEDPLVKGIVDYFQSKVELRHILLVGPSKEGAQLEGSKDYAKAFMAKNQIPTARYQTFTAKNIEDGLAYLQTMNTPIVLKADGLAAGKGVIIATSYQEAADSLREMLLDKKFGSASESVVIEEFLDGIELSIFVLTDGEDYLILPEAKDYKRIGEQDTGLNTGGMGAVSPVTFANAEFLKKVEDRIIKPTIKGLKNDKIGYKGFVFIGLMNVAGDPYVIEYNVRMGDPETEVVVPRIESDLVEVLVACAEGKLKNASLKISPKIAATVMMVAGGYPGDYEKGKKISGHTHATKAFLYHAGTKLSGNEVLTNGGRIMTSTGLGNSLDEALAISYEGVNQVCWEGIYFRKDIGQDLRKLAVQQ